MKTFPFISNESGGGTGLAFKRKPNRPSVFASLTALLVGIGLAAGVPYAQSVAGKGRLGGPEPDDQAPVVHPKLWPESKSPISLNPTIEGRIDLLLNRMTVEEKIGQVIQPEWKSISPVEVAQYHIGSIEAGGACPYCARHYGSRCRGAAGRRLRFGASDRSTEGAPHRQLCDPGDAAVLLLRARPH
jgi:hypothetical protein